jgi:hypothetical protein
MKHYRATALVLAVVVCLLALTITVFAADNFTGTWKLNLQKSQYDPGPPPRSLTSHVEIMGDTANFTFDGYEANGKAIAPGEITIKLDGKDYPIEGDPARDTIAMKKIDDYTMEETNKKGGKVTTITRTVYAKDGKSRTATTTGTTPDGQKVNNVAFFDRLG